MWNANSAYLNSIEIVLGKSDGISSDYLRLESEVGTAIVNREIYEEWNKDLTAWIRNHFSQLQFVRFEIPEHWFFHHFQIIEPCNFPCRMLFVPRDSPFLLSCFSPFVRSAWTPPVELDSLSLGWQTCLQLLWSYRENTREIDFSKIAVAIS